MESDNKEKSVVEEYLRQNKDEAQNQINIDGTKSSPAPLGKRAAAAIVDRLILFVIATYVLSSVFRSAHGFTFLLYFSNILSEFVYAGYFYSAHSATPGKMIFNLQVVRDSGTKLNFMEAGFRDGVGKLISGLILGIGYLMAFFRADKRTLHDLIFKTKVVVKT